MYNNMQTSIAMSKSFKKKFKKAKLQAQYELKKDFLSDEAFIKKMMVLVQFVDYSQKYEFRHIQS